MQSQILQEAKADYENKSMQNLLVLWTQEGGGQIYSLSSLKSFKREQKIPLLIPQYLQI